MMADTILFKDCTLEQFTDALVRGNGFGHESMWIKSYFGDQTFGIVEETVGQYEHNICQFVMDEFFGTQLGFKKVRSTFYDEGGEVAVTYENLEYDLKQFRKVYKNAFVMYEREDGEKLSISINKFSPREIIYRAYANPERETIISDWLTYSKEHNLYKTKKIDADCNFLKLSDVSWKDIILPPDTIKVIRSNVGDMFEMREYLDANGIPLKGGVIFAGPPGTGKTVLCKILAKELDVTVIYAMPDHLSKTGDIKRVCEMAKDLAPCMLIIEDIDYIAEDRNEAQNKGGVIELMNYLDGVQEFNNVVTLATTNAVDMIEDAVKNRPGRFDRVITVPKPNGACRRKMFKEFTARYIIPEDFDFDELVRQTKDLSGAHIKDLCKTAARAAIRERNVTPEKIAIVTQEHFGSALKEVMNIDYSSYLKAQNRKTKVGFSFEDDE
jgi:SpoVK/Ycf46/Vps4 family AAA+-type ATPase